MKNLPHKKHSTYQKRIETELNYYYNQLEAMDTLKVYEKKILEPYYKSEIKKGLAKLSEFLKDASKSAFEIKNNIQLNTQDI